MIKYQIGYVSDMDVPRIQARLVESMLINHAWVERVLFASEVIRLRGGAKDVCEKAIKFENQLLKSGDRNFVHIDAKILPSRERPGPGLFEPKGYPNEYFLGCGVWSIDLNGRYCLPPQKFFGKEALTRYDYRKISCRPWYWKKTPGYEFWLKSVRDMLKTAPELSMILKEDLAAGMIAPAIYAEIINDTRAENSVQRFIIPEFTPSEKWVQRIQSSRFKRRMKWLTWQNRIRRSLIRNGVLGTLRVLVAPYLGKVVKCARKAASVVKRRLINLILKEVEDHPVNNRKHGIE